MAEIITVRHKNSGMRKHAAEITIRQTVRVPDRLTSHSRTVTVCSKRYTFGDVPEMKAKPIDTFPIKYTWGRNSGPVLHRSISPRVALKTSPEFVPAVPHGSIRPKAEPSQIPYIKIQCQEKHCPYGKKPCIFNELEPIGFHGRLHFRCKCKHSKGSPPQYVDVVVKKSSD